MNAGSAFRLTLVLVLTLSLAVYSGGLLRLHDVRADPAPAAPSDPSTQWVPAGPMVDKILVTTYADENGEFGALKGNMLDLTDWTLSAADVPSTCPAGSTAILCDSRFYATGPVAATDMLSVEFNHANSFFGINFGFGRDSNPDALRALNFRQGVAHLIDRQAFVAKQLGGLGNAIDNSLPSGQTMPHSGLPFDNTCQPGPSPTCTGSYSNDGYTLGGVCSWDVLHPKVACISAFKDGADTSDSAGVVLASASNPDFCDAADHWIASGLATGKSATDCHLTGLSSALSQGHIAVVIPRDYAPRLNLGISLAERICELINGLGVTFCSQVSTGELQVEQYRSIVYATDVIHLDWHMFISFWGLGPTPTQVWALYNGGFASNACGGTFGPFGSNYVYFCNPRFDRYNSMVELNSSNTGMVGSLQVANEIFGSHTAAIPLFSPSSDYAYVKGWTGVNNGKSTGPPNTLTLLNMWKSSPAVVGNIRWGFRQGTINPNPMGATSSQDLNWMSEVYDPLIATNPYSPSDAFGWMVNQWQILAPQPGDPPGTVSDIKFNLRNDIFFHDGKQVTASDYVFSWQAFLGIGGGFFVGVASIAGVRIQNDFNFIVNLNNNGVFALDDVGGFPLLPQHLLAADITTKCTTVGTPACTVYFGADTADLVSLHQFVGSGPYVCLDQITNQVGGKCSATGSGVVPAGSSFVLTRNGFGQSGTANIAYFRTSAKYVQWQWANPLRHPQVDILDVSGAAACLGKDVRTHPECAHWDTPAASISCVPAAGSCNASSMAGLGGNNGGTVTFIEIQQAFRWFGASWNSPFAYAAFSDPTGCGGTGCGAQPFPQLLYEGGIIYTVIP